MPEDLTLLDSFAWEAVKKALNQRVVVSSARLVSSRVNRVWVVETDVRPVVVKRFLSGKSGNEFESLLIAKRAGLSVPYPLCKERDYLVTEYISGESCDVMINKMFSDAAAEGIGSWLASYHSLLSDGPSKRIMVDASLSNFILSDGRVFGVDLEDSKTGDPMDDIGKAAASVLDSEPFFTPVKFDLCAKMIRSYEKEMGCEIMERVRPFVSKHLREDARLKPLFRRTLLVAARSLETGWPRLV